VTPSFLFILAPVLSARSGMTFNAPTVANTEVSQ
jgi:hypothetical protein